MTHPLATYAELAAAWRAECAFRQTIYMETIDRVPVALLIALLDHAFPPATSGYATTEPPPRFTSRHEAEKAWLTSWLRFDADDPDDYAGGVP